MKKDTKKYKNIYNIINNKKNELKLTIAKRYNVLICIIIFIMIIMLGNLFVIQVVKHGFYINKIELLKTSTVSSVSTPRGRIYDRNGKIIVDNEAVKVIYYQKPKNVTLENELLIAYKVAQIIDLDYSKLSETNKKKFWIKNHREKADEKITSEEWQKLDERKLTTKDIENLKLERVEEEVKAFKELDLEAAYIYNLMNVGYSYDEKIIKKENVSDEEYAMIAENINIIQGFDVRLDWIRVYPYGNVFKTILGSVSTTEVGLPYELKDYYLSQGYSLNDRVGISYLEYQYEALLKGEKTIYKKLADGSFETIKEGKRGKDIVLTIDIELQKEIEKILEEEILNAKGEPNTKYYDHSFAIISEPKTGQILAMSGKQVVLKDGEYKNYDYTPGIITTSVTAGSIVKGASHIVGYNNNAIKIGERRQDKCIKIIDTPLKCSWTSLGVVDDVTALKFSSNIYQFHTAINVGQGNYQYDKPLNINTNAFSIYRNTFKEFGLGTLTGIDLPNESLGYKGTSILPGHLLDFSIGQYDTYTPIQLIQYINTIANDGYRVEPHLLKSVYEPTKEALTDLVYQNETKTLNKINTKSEYLDRVKEGFKEVMHNGTGSGYMGNIPNSAGKTGTSESFLDTNNDSKVDAETMSNTFGGYYPYNDPKVSFVVVSPDVYYNETSTYRTAVNKKISFRISQKYFEMYK